MKSKKQTKINNASTTTYQVCLDAWAAKTVRAFGEDDFFASIRAHATNNKRLANQTHKNEQEKNAMNFIRRGQLKT